MERQVPNIQKKSKRYMKAYKFKINGKDYSVEVNEVEGKNARVKVNGVDYDVELEDELVSSAPVAPIAPAASPASATAAAKESSSAPLAPSAPASGPGHTVNSPLPGVIISIDVKEGQPVKAGQRVAVLEAMKMENDIQADSDGTVTAILVQKGDSVLEGAAILSIA